MTLRCRSRSAALGLNGRRALQRVCRRASPAPAVLLLIVPILPGLPGLPTAPAAAVTPAPPAPSAAPSAPAAAGLGLIEALRLMLENDPNLVIARSHEESARGAFFIQKGVFDTVITSSFGYTDTRTPFFDAPSGRSTTLATTLAASQELRNGLTLNPEVDLGSTSANQEITGLPGIPPIVNTASVSFILRQPLLRGRGREAADAAEQSALRELEASGLDLRHATAQRILTVVNQYWTLVATRLDLDILISNEDRSRTLLATTRRLIEADITAPAEAVQLEANLAAAEAQRFAGQNALLKARQDLGREIGLDGARTAALAPPSDAFPDIAPGTLAALDAAPFVAGALRRRADLLAARKRDEEARLLEVAAQNALLPQLDLVLKPSYSGVLSGGGLTDFFAPLGRHIPGVSSSLALDLSLPVRHDTARGQLLQAHATREQNAALLDQLTKSIGTDVPTAVDTVLRTAQQLDRAKEAVRLFERAVANEERKLSAGSSTVLDVITQQNRLLTAQQTEVSAQLSLALALVNLRFDTGTILATSGALTTVDSHHVATVPAAAEMSP